MLECMSLRTLCLYTVAANLACSKYCNEAESSLRILKLLMYSSCSKSCKKVRAHRIVVLQSEDVSGFSYVGSCTAIAARHCTVNCNEDSCTPALVVRTYIGTTGSGGASIPEGCSRLLEKARRGLLCAEAPGILLAQAVTDTSLVKPSWCDVTFQNGVSTAFVSEDEVYC